MCLSILPLLIFLMICYDGTKEGERMKDMTENAQGLNTSERHLLLYQYLITHTSKSHIEHNKSSYLLRLLRGNK